MTHTPGSILDTLSRIPASEYRGLFLVIGGVIAVVFVLKLVLRVNRLVLITALVVGFFVLMANWLYNRDEPAILTPFFDRVGEFLPHKGVKTRQYTVGELPRPNDAVA